MPQIKKDIDKVLKFFKIGKQSGTRIILTDKIRYGDTNFELRIGKNQPYDDIILTLIHELLHTLGLNHDELGRFLGFYSLKRDILSEWIAERLFKRKMRWSYD